jgi:hypothetical protein
MREFMCSPGWCRYKSETLSEKYASWALWLVSVIPATREAEIRRIKVQSQPRQIVRETLSRKTLLKKALVEWLKW